MIEQASYASADLEMLVAKITSCRLCRDTPLGAPLPHEPRPVLRVSSSAKICICGQAPGTRVHASGTPFTDPSGIRLRNWMGVTEEQFYDAARVAIVPMGFCFPGLSKTGADLPPRPECATAWHGVLFEKLPRFEILLLVGSYAQRWHLKQMGASVPRTVTQTVENWRDFAENQSNTTCVLPLPHPSWRNNGWIKKNPWFEAELLPVLQSKIRNVLA